MTSNQDNYQFFTRAFGSYLVLGVILLFGGISCGGRKSPEVPPQPKGQARDQQAAEQPVEPIVRLDPPKMDEPKADAPKGELLRLRLEKGYEETRLFEGQSWIQFAGAEPITQEIRMRVTTQVKQVDGDVYAILLEPSAVTLQQQGRQGQSGLLTEEPTLVDVDSRGRLLTPTSALVSDLQTIGFVPLPEKRVAPGATWSLSGERTWPLLGKVTVKETFTYRGIEQLDGRKVYRIDQRVQGSLSSITTEATYYLDVETGTLRQGKVQIKGKMHIPGPDGSKNSAEVSIRLTIRQEHQAR